MMKEEKINHNIIKIILTNEERKYLGLTPIESHWERVDIKHVTLFFDGDVIRKKITHAEFESQQFSYLEEDVCVETAENRTIVLPKTLRGRIFGLELRAKKIKSFLMSGLILGKTKPLKKI